MIRIPVLVPWLAAAAMLGAVIPSASAGHGETADAKQAPLIEFERYTLDNGLEVILHQDNRVPLVVVNVWYHVGSGDEDTSAGQSGFAHLYEHLFKNSKHLGDRQHYEVLRSAGSVSANATTSPDRTAYFEVMPSHQLETALWIESDRMGYFLPGLTQERLDRQIEVVRNERRQRYDNTPYGRERLAVADALYQDGHPYKYLTIGRHEDIEGATMEHVVDFYRRWYVPANATLVLAGDFEADDARRLVDKWFGSFPRSERPASRRIEPEPIRATRRVEVHDPFAKLRRVRYAWHSPSAFAAGDAELQLVATILAQTGTGRLYRSLVHERQLAQRVTVYQSGNRMSGQFHVTVDLRTDADLAEVERILGEQLAALAETPPDERELARAVTRREAAFIWRLESLTARASALHSYNHHVGDPGYASQDLARYRQSSAADVQAAVRRWLAPEARVEVITLPAPRSDP